MPDDPLAPFRRELRPDSTDEQTWETLTEHQALGLAIAALNQVPNHTLNGDYKDTYKLLNVLDDAYGRGGEHEDISEVKPQVIRLLETFEDFIRAAERDHGENYWAIRTDIEQVLSKIYPERERAIEEAERRYLEQDIEPER